MKLSTMLLSMLLTSALHSQTLLDQPTGKSTTVVCLVNATPLEAYAMTATVLQDQLFNLEKTDGTLFFVQTDWKQAKGFFVYDWRIIANIREQDGTTQIHLRAETRQQHDKTTQQYLGKEESVIVVEKRSNAGKDWKALMAIAEKLSSEWKYK